MMDKIIKTAGLLAILVLTGAYLTDPTFKDLLVSLAHDVWQQLKEFKHE